MTMNAVHRRSPSTYPQAQVMPDYVNWLRHASYINAHRDCTFVVMLPGDGVEHPNFGNIVHDLVLLHSLGVRLVLVHGSRPQIEAAWPPAA
jgi:amino-acid N-acetyltransferase